MSLLRRHGVVWAALAAALALIFTGHRSLGQILVAFCVVASMALPTGPVASTTPFFPRVRALLARTGPVTCTLIAANIAVAITAAALAAHAGQDPVTLTSKSPLISDWALTPDRGGPTWQLLSYAFVHAGPLHLALNMTALATLGRDLEKGLGTARYLTVYVASALGGGAAVLAWSSTGTPVVGASGAIFGLLAFFAVNFINCHRDRASIAACAVVIGGSMAFSLLPGVSLAGHVGGLLVGATLAAIHLATNRVREP